MGSKLSGIFTLKGSKIKKIAILSTFILATLGALGAIVSSSVYASPENSSTGTFTYRIDYYDCSANMEEIVSRLNDFSIKSGDTWSFDNNVGNLGELPGCGPSSVLGGGACDIASQIAYSAYTCGLSVDGKTGHPWIAGVPEAFRYWIYQWSMDVTINNPFENSVEFKTKLNGDGTYTLTIEGANCGSSGNQGETQPVSNQPIDLQKYLSENSELTCTDQVCRDGKALKNECNSNELYAPEGLKDGNLVYQCLAGHWTNPVKLKNTGDSSNSSKSQSSTQGLEGLVEVASKLLELSNQGNISYSLLEPYSWDPSLSPEENAANDPGMHCAELVKYAVERTDLSPFTISTYVPTILDTANNNGLLIGGISHEDYNSGTRFDTGILDPEKAYILLEHYEENEAYFGENVYPTHVSIYIPGMGVVHINSKEDRVMQDSLELHASNIVGAIPLDASGQVSPPTQTELSEKAAALWKTVNENPYLRAFLAVIPGWEGTLDSEGKIAYFRNVGGGEFTDCSVHPSNLVETGYGPSDAAGGFQIMSSTDNGLSSNLGLTNFCEDAQTIKAAALVQRRLNGLGYSIDEIFKEGLTKEKLFELIETADNSKKKYGIGCEWAGLPSECLAAVGHQQFNPAIKGYASMEEAQDALWKQFEEQVQLSIDYKDRISLSISLPRKNPDIGSSSDTSPSPDKIEAIKFSEWVAKNTYLADAQEGASTVRSGNPPEGKECNPGQGEINTNGQPIKLGNTYLVYLCNAKGDRTGFWSGQDTARIIFDTLENKLRTIPEPKPKAETTPTAEPTLQPTPQPTVTPTPIIEITPSTTPSTSPYFDLLKGSVCYADTMPTCNAILVQGETAEQTYYFDVKANNGQPTILSYTMPQELRQEFSQSPWEIIKLPKIQNGKVQSYTIMLAPDVQLTVKAQEGNPFTLEQIYQIQDSYYSAIEGGEQSAYIVPSTITGFSIQLEGELGKQPNSLDKLIGSNGTISIVK